MKSSKTLFNDYLKKESWRVKENATVDYSVGGLILSNSAAVTSDYWLNEVYPEEIANLHKNADIHIHDLSMYTPYCAGWSLKQLITEGLGGVSGKVQSSPARHLFTLCNQMVNFLGIMQNEWAGAQAFSSFDTYLAPFVRADNLTYKEVKQCIQSFVYGVNTPSRWGCVPEDTEVLSTNGFMSLNELKEGDKIYTWNMDTHKLELNTVRKVIAKPFKGKLHSYKNGRGYEQTVTPNHRMLVYKHNSDDSIIKKSEEIFDVKTPFPLPTRFSGSTIGGINLSDDLIKLSAMIYADGSIDIRPNGSVHKVMLYKSENRVGNDDIVDICSKNNLTYTLKKKKSFGVNNVINCYTFYGDSARFIVDLVGQKDRIDEKFFSMNQKQSELFLKTWASFDGSYERFKIQCDNESIENGIQHIAILAGYTSYKCHRRKTNYIKIRQYNYVIPSKRTEEEYDGLVWCPNVENGTAVFRRNGNVFISGQTQAPFCNITLDWTVPNDLAELQCIVGGKEMDFCYKDCKKEMDMINKAFIEIMIEGDDNGRGFQYPIPTYSITKDFDWSDTENNRLLFEMTAKYGTPYFSNYINSDMEPSDVRSMCPLTPDTLVVVKSEQNGVRVDTIHNIYNTYLHHGTVYDVWTGKEWCKGKPVKVDKTDVYEIEFSNGYKVRMGENHLQPTKDFGTLKSSELKAGMWIPFNKNSYGSDLGSYNLGYVVGAYAGDGSHDDSSIVYSLDAREKDDDTEKVITTTWRSLGFDTKTTFADRTVRFVRVNGNPYDIVNKYVVGDSALTKQLTNKTFNSSKEFKLGFIDGLLATDGSREKRRIYTSSKDMVRDLYTLLSSVGIKCTKTTDDNLDGRYGDNTNYCVGLPLRQRYGDIFDEDDNYFYYQIKSINKTDYAGDYLYCFEVDNDDHLFSLACGLITHNCRLRLDLRELRKKQGGFFGSGESTGSVGVVTINMPRIAYTSKTEEEFFERLDYLMDKSAESLHIKRGIMNQELEGGLYPYTKRYLGTLNNHFSTIGLVGMNEACLNANWIDTDISSDKAVAWVEKVLNHMRNKLSDYQEKYNGELFNLEATPAESTSYRLAKHDKKEYPDIITAPCVNGTPYYTNSSHLPVNYTDDIFSALDIQDKFQVLYTSGTVFHAFLGEKLPDWQSAMKLVRKIAENYKLPYYTISPTYSVCTEHGYISGEHEECPICGNKTEVYSRITGYYRPVALWNDGKTEEYKTRLEYVI